MSFNIAYTQFITFWCFL